MVLVEYYIVNKKNEVLDDKPTFSLNPIFHLKKDNGEEEKEEVITQYIYEEHNPSQHSQFIHLLNKRYDIDQQLRKKRLTKKEKKKQLDIFQTLHDHIVESSNDNNTNNEDVEEIQYIINLLLEEE